MKHKSTSPWPFVFSGALAIAMLFAALITIPPHSDAYASPVTPCELATRMAEAYLSISRGAESAGAFGDANAANVAALGYAIQAESLCR